MVYLRLRFANLTILLHADLGLVYGFRAARLETLLILKDILTSSYPYQWFQY